MDVKLQRILSHMQSIVPRQEYVDQVMLRQMQRIRIRTLAGRDVNGFPFARKKDGSPSTLFKTGNLLRSLQATAGEGERGLVGRVHVTGRAREYAPYVNARRKFMGASLDDRMDMLSEMRDLMRSRR